MIYAEQATPRSPLNVPVKFGVSQVHPVRTYPSPGEPACGLTDNNMHADGGYTKR